jgi:arylformamidase
MCPDSNPTGELEFQFNPRKAVPDFAAMQEARRGRSREFLDGAHGIRRMSTASSHPVELIFSGARRQQAPLFVFLHGGYWRAGAAGDNAMIIPALCAIGVQPVLMGYPLCPGISLPELIDVVRENVAWVIDHAAMLGANAEPVIVAGVSAGAHLAAKLLTVRRSPFDRIGGALLLTGIYDLTAVPLISVNSEIGLSHADVEGCSPMFDPPPRPMPMVLATGSEEPALWRSQTQTYGALCRAAGCDVTFIELKNCNHFSVIDALTEEGGELVAALKVMKAAVWSRSESEETTP